MKIIKRQDYIDIWKNLSQEKNMIFLAGPRQSGKTTLAKDILKDYPNNLYFNWDIISDKRKLIEDPYFFEDINRKDDSVPLVIFDEIHKYSNWKNYLKGAYDGFYKDFVFLVSGSGRLDLYQKGGDSLAGRYLMFNLFPFTLSELSEKKRGLTEFLDDPLSYFKKNKSETSHRIWRDLFELSGFPEPYTKGTKAFWRKWSQNYSKQIIYEDIRDMSGIRRVDDVALLFSLLPSKVGSPLSINNLAGDLGLTFDTVKNWLQLFDASFLTFRISPWSKKVTRAITKEKKIYLFNYPLIEDEGARFENMVALELKKWVNNWNSLGGGVFDLRYIRNKEKEEVDFLITNNQKPFLLIETKNGDATPAKSLIDFAQEINVPAVQLVNRDDIYKLKRSDNTLVVTAYDWLSSLP